MHTDILNPREWMLRQDHDEDVRNILKSQKCMDTLGRIRQWKPDVRVLMAKCGHTSLGFNSCACKTGLAIAADSENL